MATSWWLSAVLILLDVIVVVGLLVAAQDCQHPVCWEAVAQRWTQPPLRLLFVACVWATAILFLARWPDAVPAHIELAFFTWASGMSGVLRRVLTRQFAMRATLPALLAIMAARTLPSVLAQFSLGGVPFALASVLCLAIACRLSGLLSDFELKSATASAARKRSLDQLQVVIVRASDASPAVLAEAHTVVQQLQLCRKLERATVPVDLSSEQGLVALITEARGSSGRWAALCVPDHVVDAAQRKCDEGRRLRTLSAELARRDVWPTWQLDIDGSLDDLLVAPDKPPTLEAMANRLRRRRDNYRELRRAITEECQQPLPEVSMQRLQDLLEQVCRLEVSEPADCSGLPRSPQISHNLPLSPAGARPRARHDGRCVRTPLALGRQSKACTGRDAACFVGQRDQG